MIQCLKQLLQYFVILINASDPDAIFNLFKHSFTALLSSCRALLSYLCCFNTVGLFGQNGAIKNNAGCCTQIVLYGALSSLTVTKMEKFTVLNFPSLLGAHPGLECLSSSIQSMNHIELWGDCLDFQML